MILQEESAGDGGGSELLRSTHKLPNTRADVRKEGGAIVGSKLIAHSFFKP